MLGCSVDMAGLSEILGQPRARAVLRAARESGRVAHGYIFEGPDGVGKMACARMLAMALNCERDDRDGCGECESCQKVASGAHPDVIAFDMTPKGLTERVRELVTLCGYRPHEGRVRVVIMDRAGELAGAQGDRTEAANVLLKTLEEPPTPTCFVLCTSEPRKLPITVRSRCQRVRFLPLSDDVVEQILVERHGAAPGAARAAAAQAGGSAGRALAELDTDSAESPEAARTRVQALVQAARKGDPRALFEAAGELGGDRELALGACASLWTTLRDALLVRESLSRGRVPPARAEAAAQLFGDYPAARLLVALRATQEASTALRGNVAPSLVLEHLMLQAFGAGRSA